MIAIFTVLGLLLFGGGAYAIYDVWPYLVLERGFTEVIIGAIATTGGLLMLSLAWVLRDLKKLRIALAEVAEARAFVPPAVQAPIPAPPRIAVPARETMDLSPAVPIAVGAGAVAVAAAEAEAIVKPEMSDKALERDLFGALVADKVASSADEDEPTDEQAEPLRDETVPDMFGKDAAFIEPPAEGTPPVAVEDESHEPAEIVTAKVQPLGQDEALARSDEQARIREEDETREEAGTDEEIRTYADAETDDRPEVSNFAVTDAEFVEAVPEPEEEPSAEEPETARDEFSALRESLTSQLGDLHLPTGRIEPSLAPSEDPFAEAESWMGRVSGRQEPRFETQAPDSEPVEAEPAMPAWPPRTGTPPLSDVSTRAVTEHEPELAPQAESGLPAADEAAEPADGDDTASETVEKDAVGEPAATAPEPAASEEGIVGAYQVGDAHFTIYADGSIRARTPDGEYSFASMDELKVYLASEKSRLGV